jgi:hypothetical protein
MLSQPDNKKTNIKAGPVLPLIILISFLFTGWGYIGHRIINYNTILSALPQMEFFETWADSIRAHASDADYRRSWDPDEEPKHYIDIDNYPEFIATGTIPQNFDSLVAIHGLTFVIDQGILPWAILKTADSLETLFELNDMHTAMLVAADLGHYIGDAHMPLHITRNYNGQYTNQYGVHSRYESTLIQNFQSQIVYEGDTVEYINNLDDFVFEMLYDNYRYVDSVLYADSVAYAFAGHNYNTTYYNKFWEIAKEFTTGLFQRASYKLTCLIYTKWLDAGNASHISESEIDFENDFRLYQNYPNPFNPLTVISWQSSAGNRQTIKVYDILGNEVATLIDEYREAGKYQIEFNATQLASGVYFYRFSSGDYLSIKKMILLK